MERKIIAYELFSCATPVELDLYINEKIRVGWQPYGYMQAIQNGENILFTQVVVKYDV
jgi:hypothetical protein